MYIVTGGAGFIGSAFVWKLNQEGIDRILIVDELESSEKWKNLVGLRFDDYVDKDAFMHKLLETEEARGIQGIIHMGACSSTTEQNMGYLMENNFEYTKLLAEWALEHNIRFIYASSGATYGDGSAGYSDEDATTQKLRPLNPYGYSKQIFDLWALKTGTAKAMVGLKFFNVFGPNEYHKGDMMSVVHKAFQQIQETGTVRLFKSHREDYADGEQQRDFVYVKDCVNTLWWLLQHPDVHGIFNVGTGKARTWKDLVHAVFKAMGRDPNITYINMPETIRDRYQYFTEANIKKLQRTGAPLPSTPLEAAIHDYVTNYLQTPSPYLSAR